MLASGPYAEAELGGGGELQQAGRGSRQRGRDALAEAFRREHEAIVEMLLARPPAPPSELDRGDWAKLKSAGRWLGRVACLDSAEEARTFFAYYGQSVAAVLAYQGSDGFTALHFAARHGSVATAALLVRNGADAFARDFYGRSPHHYANLCAPAGLGPSKSEFST